MSEKLTAAQQVIKRLQYKPESTFYTFEDTIGAYLSPGVMKKTAFKDSQGYRRIDDIGPEDLYALLASKRVHMMSFTFEITDGTKAFLKFLFNAQNVATPANTPNQPLSFLFSFYLNGAERFVKMTGGHCVTATISGGVDRSWEVTCEFMFKNIAEPSATGLATATYATAPTGDTWDWLSGGTAPVSWNSLGINATEVSITFNRNTNGEWAMGNAEYYAALPHGREMGGTVKTLYTNVTMSGDYNTKTARAFAIVLKTAQYTLTFGSAKLVDKNGPDIEAGSKEALKQEFAITPMTFTDLA